VFSAGISQGLRPGEGLWSLRDVWLSPTADLCADMTVAELTTTRSCGRHCLAGSIVTCSIS
jgi:hypothetical protein